MTKTTTLLIGLCCGWVVTAQAQAAPAAPKPVVIKVATLAPRGSIWMRYLDRMNAEIRKETADAVQFRFYAGQIQGDEADVVRKMGTGQLHGGAFTSVGLAALDPQVLVLQLPLLFDTYEQVDRVRQALTPELEAGFVKKGYVLLGWGEMGWIHVFTKNRAASLAELRKQRMWVRPDDTIGKAMMQAMGLKPRPLAVPQVYPALNTGMVDAVYNSPLGCLALQWHSKLRFVTSQPLTLGITATVITKAIFDKLSPAHQRKVKEIAMRYHRALIKRTRRDNDKALKALTSLGIKQIPISEADRQAQRRAADKVAKSLTPRYYPRSLLDRVRALTAANKK